MSTKGRVLSISAVAVTMLFGGTALAALTSAEQKCLDGYNNKLRLVGQQAGKDYRSCIKNAGKGTPGADACVANDTPGKIAGKESKVCDLYTLGKCTGAEPIQLGSCAPANTAMVDRSQELVRGVFGDPISDATVVSPGKTDAKCQDKAYQRSEQLFTVKLKVFRKCKKDGMKAGTITGAASLTAACAPNTGIPDPDGKIASKVTKLHDDVNANCGTTTIATRFPGDCSGSGSTAALGDCLERLVECQICQALTDVDQVSTNCDLFDDGIANGSCGIPLHKCTLTGGIGNSYVNIYSAAFPVPIAFDTSGSALDIGGAGGVAKCNIQNFNPINIIAIGYVCIQPAGGCANGTRYCGPGAPGSGPALGIDFLSDGLVGACTGNAQCDATCTTQCPIEYPGTVKATDGACTGYCTSGAQMACTTDAQCGSAGQGSCNGPDNPGANANKCQCGCINAAAFGGSDPGDLQCQLGSDLKVEMAPPCNGTDILINVGTTCIPLTSERAHGRIDDGNFVPGSTVPGPMPGPNANDQSGAPLACATVDASTLTGLATVGAVNFFGSTIGDLTVGLKATCM